MRRQAIPVFHPLIGFVIFLGLKFVWFGKNSLLVHLLILIAGLFGFRLTWLP